jgi:uncharacterized protein (DUF2267 family)
VRNRLPTDDRDEAADIATVVLETFSEILYRTERDKLTAPLPKPSSGPFRPPGRNPPAGKSSGSPRRPSSTGFRPAPT